MIDRYNNETNKYNDLKNDDIQIITDIEFQDAGQVSMLRKQLENKYKENELKKQSKYEKFIQGVDQPQNVQNQVKPIIEFQDYKSLMKNKNAKRLIQTGNSFYGSVQQNQVQQKISSIKDSIASAYLQSESSLSPFIQIYLGQALKQKKKQNQKQHSQSFHKSYLNETSNDLRGNLNTEGDFIDDIQLKRHNYMNEPINQTELDMKESDKNNLNSQAYKYIIKNISPSKNQSLFIKDKMERMHSITGDYLIEQDLIRVVNVLSANENDIQSTESQVIPDAFISTNGRFSTSNARKQLKNQKRTKTTTDENFYSNLQNTASFYENTYKDTNITQQNTEYNNFKTEQSDPFQATKQNMYWSVKSQDYQQKKPINIYGTDLERNISQSNAFDISLQKFSKEQSSKQIKPQRAQSQGPKSGNVIQNNFYNADPNNTILKDYFGQVDNINLNNIFVNQLGITEEQRNQMFDKMDPETRQKIQQKFFIQEKISKFSKQNNKQYDEFQQSFKNNFIFIEDEQKKTNQQPPSIYLRSQKCLNSPEIQIKNEVNTTIYKKRGLSVNQVSHDETSRFQTPVKISKLVNYSRIKTESDSFTDYRQRVKRSKKDVPLYINRINRVRLQSFSLSKSDKKKDILNSSNNQINDCQNISKNDINQQQKVQNFIDPRRVYRQNIDSFITQKSVNNTEKNTLSDQLIVKNINQSESFKQKPFFQNTDAKKRIHSSNIKINV